MHAQSCLTCCDPANCGPPGFSVHVTFQTRTLERVAISYSRVSLSFWPRQQTGALAGIFLLQSHLGSSTKYGHKIGIKHKLKSELYTDFCSSHLWATEHSYIKIFPPYDQFYELKFRDSLNFIFLRLYIQSTNEVNSWATYRQNIRKCNEDY